MFQLLWNIQVWPGRMLGFGGAILSWLLLIVFSHWHLGIWVLDDYRSMSGFLSSLFLMGVFRSLVSVSPLVFWSFWPETLGTSMTSDHDWPSGGWLGRWCSRCLCFSDWCNLNLFFWLVWSESVLLTGMAWICSSTGVDYTWAVKVCGNWAWGLSKGWAMKWDGVDIGMGLW